MTAPAFPSRLIVFPLLALALLSARVSADTASTIARMAPEETIAYVEVRSVTELRAAWEKTPYHALWTSAELAPFLQPIRENLDTALRNFESEKGLTLAECQRLFPGDVAIFLADTMQVSRPWSEAPVTDWNVGLIARVGEGQRDAIAQLVEKHAYADIPPNAERSTEEFKGVRIFTTVYEGPMSGSKGKSNGAEVDSPGSSDVIYTWEFHYQHAFVGDYFVLLEGHREFMKKIITNHAAATAASPAATSMAGTPSFIGAMRPVAEQPDLFLYANIGRAIEQLLTYPFAEKLKEMPVLGLDEFRSGVLSARLAPDHLRMDNVLHTADLPRGVARFFVNQEENAFRSLALVPSDALSYSCWRFDLASMFDLIRQAVGQAQGDQGQAYDLAMAGTSGFTKVNMGEFVKKIGGEMAVYSLPSLNGLPTGGEGQTPSSVFVFEVRKDPALAGELAKITRSIIGFFGPGVALDEVEFQGHSLFVVEGDPVAAAQMGMMAEDLPQFVFAVADGLLVISDTPENVKEALRRISGKGEKDIRDNGDFQKARQSLRPGYNMMGWADYQKCIDLVARDLASNKDIAGILRDQFPIGSLPEDFSISRYLGQSISVSYCTRDTRHSFSTLQYPKEFVRP